MPVKVLADSGSDLPLEFFKDNNMKLFPLKVLLKEQEYEDLITIEPKTIYTAIRNGEVPKTSQVSPIQFVLWEPLNRKISPFAATSAAESK